MASDALVLPAVLDLKAAAPLKAALLEHRGGDVQIDASGVQRLGALCLQVLLAGGRAWSEDGHAYRIEPRSDAFSDTLTLFGAADRLSGPDAPGETL